MRFQMTRMRKMNNQTAWWKKKRGISNISEKLLWFGRWWIWGLERNQRKTVVSWKLGVDVIWLNPIYESPQVDNGYDISNYKNRAAAWDDGRFWHAAKEAHERESASFWILLSIIHRTNIRGLTEAKKGKKIHIMIITYGKIRSRITGDQALADLHGSM